jgi:phage terminase large subunit
MANINLKISKKMFSPHFFPYLFDYEKRWNIFMGSAGSGKSFFVQQKLTIKACNEKRKILMCRRYGSTISNSIWSLQLDILRQWKLLGLCKVNKSDRTITLPNGSQFIFIGLDDENKLLSINNVSDVFIEEVFECNQELLDQLSIRMRGKAKNQQIYCCFNPISPHSFLYPFCEGDKQPKSFFYDKSTYKDNPFLSKDYVEALEDLYRTNPNKARIFCYGFWGVDVEGLVFGRNTQFVKDLDVNELLKNPKLEVRVGSDSGVIDASTIAVSLWDKENKIIYVIDEWYARCATLDEHYQAIIDLGLEKQRIFVDSADTRLIQFLKSKGINAVPTKKGAGSVEKRIDFLLNHQIIVLTDRCSSATAEFQNFSWIKDKQTGAFTERTTHEWSHYIDGLSYAYNDIYMAKAKVHVYSSHGLGF